MNRFIAAIGCLLIIVSVALAIIFPTFFGIAIAILVFGIGCATIWFGFIQPAIHNGEERMKIIQGRVDTVRQRVESQKK